MRIYEGVAMLEIPTNVLGQPGVIYPTLLWDDNNVILVDAGFPGQLPLIRQAIAEAGVPFDKLSKVIITHHDVDHMGSLKSMQVEFANRLEVLSHEEEKPYIQGDKKPLKMAQLEMRLESLPKEMKNVYEKLKAFYNIGTAKVTETVNDGDQIPCCGGIEIIYTPGHTLGHICLYIKQCKTLIAGDALGVEGGQLVKTPDTATFDMDLYMKSLEKLTKLDVSAIICYHGGFFREQVNNRIAELANTTTSVLA